MKHYSWFKKQTLILLLPLFIICGWTAPTAGRAQTAEETLLQQIINGAVSSFSLPLGDLYEKKHDSEWRNLLDGFSGEFAFEVPLSRQEPPAAEGGPFQGEASTNAAFNATLKYSPLGHWFFLTTVYAYLDRDLQALWHPDFTYVFGYDDWHPFTFSLIYSNYGGNRLNPDRSKGERFTRFNQGTWSLGWKFILPKSIERLFTVHDSGTIAGSLRYHLTPKFYVDETQEYERWRQSFSIDLKYTIFKWWYINASIYIYPDSSQQQPWDPDFTYGFGYFDWHPGTISVQYNNYSGNRFPGRKKGDQNGRFKDGSIRISWSWAF